jgi:hypothetical protein
MGSRGQDGNKTLTMKSLQLVKKSKSKERDRGENIGLV